MSQTKDSRLKQFAKSLRSEMTESEWKLWNTLRDKEIFSVHWHRQKVLGRYIVDFYCGKAKLIIEVDGSQHANEEDEKYDQKRTAFLAAKGFTVLRFWNNEILENLEGVFLAIYKIKPSIFTSPQSPLIPLSIERGRVKH